eukprot:INCI10454.1.p1 GENE.INCI10454.1~~INCI10454.1.p1  ORF type:complete len:1532 (+),score=248.93 INCI10454.1:232-4827(+)
MSEKNAAESKSGGGGKAGNKDDAAAENEADSNQSDGGDDGDDDSGSDSSEEGDVGNEAYSDEEIAWSKRYFGSDAYAKFFRVCSELKISDNAEQIYEMRRPRTWELKIRNAKFSNFQDLNDYFLQFYVGYNLQHVKKRPPKSKRKKVDEQGNRVHRKFEWHITGSMGQSFPSPCLKNLQQGETRDFAGFHEKRVWKGSYFDLYEKKLRVELWTYSRFEPNTFLTAAEAQLVDIAQGGRLRAFELTRARDVHVRRDKGQNFGRLQFVSIFQERAEFKIQLKNWRLSLEEHCIRQQARNLISEEAESCTLPVLLRVQLLRGARRSPNSRDIESFQTPVEYHKGQHVSFDIGYPLDQVIRFRGTADKLLTESLQCTLWLLVTKGLRRSMVEMATVRIPLKQVLVTGGVLGSLAYLPGRSLLAERERSQPQKDADFEVKEAPARGHDVELTTKRKMAALRSDKKFRAADDYRHSRRDDGAGVSTGEVGLDEYGLTDSVRDDARSIRSRTSDSTRKGSSADSRVLFCGQIEGNVDVSIFEDQSGSLTELWTWFRQTGELNPPEVFDYAPYNYSYIGLHIDNVRGLRMLASRDEGLNLFVSLEWAGQVYRTDTVHDWNGDAIDYTIYFQVFCISARPQVEDLIRHPFVNIYVWHESQSGHNDLIGETQFFLHNIAGKHVTARQTAQGRGPSARGDRHRLAIGGPRGAGVYHRPEATLCERSSCKKTKTRKVVIHTWRKGWLYPLLPKQYVEREVRTRVFSASLPLRSTDLNHNASIKISAWFRSPVSRNGFVDFVNTDPATAGLSKYLTLPHSDAGTERRKNALCLCAASQLGGSEVVDENDGFFDENGVGADPRSRPKCASSYHDHRIAAPVNEDDSDEEAASRSRGAGLQTLSQSDRALGCRSLRDFVDEVRKHLYRITRVKTVFEEQNPLGSLIVPDPANQNRSSLRPKFYSYLVCLDQAHVPRFLPTMLARVTPPRTFMVNQNSGRYNNLLSEEQQLGSSGSHGSKSSSSSDRSSTRPGGGAPTASGAPGLQSNIEADPSREPSSTSHTSSSVNPEGAGQGRGPVGPRIASSIRPDFSQACYELMRYVHAVEFCDGHDFDYRQDPRAIDAADIALRAGPPTGAVSSASSRVTASKQALTASLDEAQLRNERKFGIHAASPTFLLETRKGDVRDHALLLCNLFLGLNLDAYVVIGKVYRDNRLLENATEHVWVMTRENSNACCGGSNTNTRAQSTSTGQINDAAVRFWEVTNNQIYDLESRCMSVASSGGGTITGEDRGSSQTGRGNGVDSGRSTHGNGAINSHNDDSFRGVDGRGGVSASDFEIETKTSIPDQESSRGSGGVDRDVLRLLDAEEAADRTAERRAAKDQLFFTTSGLGDGKNCMSQDDVLRENKVLEQLARNDFSIKEQEDRSRLNSSIQLSANYQDQIRAIRATTAVLPYAEVYAVFNNRNLWVNMQWREENNVNVMNRDPARITYNMGLPGTEKRVASLRDSGTRWRQHCAVLHSSVALGTIATRPSPGDGRACARGTCQRP